LPPCITFFVLSMWVGNSDRSFCDYHPLWWL